MGIVFTPPLRTLVPAGILTADSIFQDEERGVQILKWLAQFRQFSLDAVDLDPLQFAQFQRLSEHRLHVLKVREESLRIFITFAAIHFASVEAPSVVKALRLAARSGDKLLTKLPECCKISFRNVEIRVKGYTSVLGGHSPILA